MHEIENHSLRNLITGGEKLKKYLRKIIIYLINMGLLKQLLSQLHLNMTEKAIAIFQLENQLIILKFMSLIQI